MSFFKLPADCYTIYLILFFYFISYTEKAPRHTSKHFVHLGVLGYQVGGSMGIRMVTVVPFPRVLSKCRPYFSPYCN